MRHIVKWLFYLIILAFVGLVAYTYIGPFFGADFAPDQNESRQTVILDAI
ncbi:MAG: hypothetical protein Q9M48_08725 [Rhodobacterales bacterium]|nr:hypothetical protein [Rhodobacterales bacterium]